MPERSIHISERWDDSGAPDGYRWRIGHETGVLDDNGYRRVEAAVRAAIADNTDSVKSTESAPTFTPITKGATEFMFERMSEPGHYDDDPDFTVDDVTPEPDPAPAMASPCIVICGDPHAGFHFTGPFDGSPAAIDYGRAFFDSDENWWEAPLGRPEPITAEPREGE
jgi:hypothetical protein